MVTAVIDNCFLFLSAHDEYFYAYQPWKEIEIQFTQKDFFQQYGLSSWIFCSHQNTQRYLLDLSVLTWRNRLGYPALTGLMSLSISPPPKNVERLIQYYVDCKNGPKTFTANNLLIAKFPRPRALTSNTVDELNSSRLTGLVSIFTLVLLLVRWWWCCCCPFLWQWTTVSLIMVVVVEMVAAWRQRQWWQWQQWMMIGNESGQQRERRAVVVEVMVTVAVAVVVVLTILGRWGQ